MSGNPGASFDKNRVPSSPIAAEQHAVLLTIDTACHGLRAATGAIGCFAVGRADLAAVAAGRRGADAAARESDAPLPFVALPADAFMPDTFYLCPSNVVNRRLVGAARVTYLSYATPL